MKREKGRPLSERALLIKATVLGGRSATSVAREFGVGVSTITRTKWHREMVAAMQARLK